MKTCSFTSPLTNSPRPCTIREKKKQRDRKMSKINTEGGTGSQKRDLGFGTICLEVCVAGIHRKSLTPQAGRKGSPGLSTASLSLFLCLRSGVSLLVR